MRLRSVQNASMRTTFRSWPAGAVAILGIACTVDHGSEAVAHVSPNAAVESDAGVRTEAAATIATQAKTSSVDDGRPPAPRLTVVPGERLHTNCGFSFIAPAGLVHHPAWGTDSCLASFTLPDCQLTGDAGWYSDSLGPQPWTENYLEEWVRLGQHKAKLVRYELPAGSDARFVAGVHVPADSALGVKTSLVLACSSEVARRRALGLLKTVRIGLEQ
jgi:hypothetical protein